MQRVAPVTDTPAERGLLPRLTALRVFGALAVFVFHIGTFEVVRLPKLLYGLGYIGVAFFFVLSGFVLAWGTRSGLPARTFYRRRFARVWPSHAAMLAVAAAVPIVSVARDADAAWASIFLVQAWFVSRPEIVYGMNGPSWSLSCEAFFYLVFPVAVLVLRRLSARWQWGLAGIGLVLSSVAAVLSPGAAFHFPMVRFSEFLLGVVAGLAMRNGWRPFIGTPVILLSLPSGLLISSLAPEPLPNTLMAVPFLLLILHLVRRDLDGRPGWLARPSLVFAGEVSFAFYLVHELIIVNLRGHLVENDSVEALFLFLLAGVAAVMLHLFLERPLNHLLRDRSRSLALAPPPGSSAIGTQSQHEPDAQAPDARNG